MCAAEIKFPSQNMKKAERFLPMIIENARSLVKEIIKDCGALKVDIHPKIAALKLSCANGGADPLNISGLSLPQANAGDNFTPCGIYIFSGIYAEGRGLRLELSSGFLDACARCVPIGAINAADEIAIPASGVAADGEASAYARMRLFAYHRTRAKREHTTASDLALFRCLCLFSLQGGKLASAHSSAVRAVLSACGEGSLGGEEAAAMASALLFAEKAADK